MYRSRRNNKKQFEVDFLNLAVTIVTLLSLMLGATFIVQGCCKIGGTGLNLWYLNSEIRFYNESQRKTDAMTEECEQLFEARRQIYNSEDSVIRIFSNLPIPLKIIALLLSICMIPFVPFAIIIQLVRSFNKWKRKKGRQMRKVQE